METETKPVELSIDQIIDVWCAALESGDYKQGTGRLCNVSDDGSKKYCCLGVLSDIYQKNVGDLVESKPSYGKHILYDNEGIVLPEKVMKWAKLNNNGGSYRMHDSMTDSLWWQNDSGVPFKEIAQIIKEKREILFVKPETQEQQHVTE